MMGSEASASSVANGSAGATIANTGELSKNSQTMTLLQPSGSSTLVFQDKKSTGGKEEGIKDDANVNILSDNALLPAVKQVASYEVSEGADSPVDDISVYVVRKGDTLSQIAQ